jgi:hypothetical protein
VSELSEANEGDEGNEGVLETDRDRLLHDALLIAVCLQDLTAGATAPNLSLPFA